MPLSSRGTSGSSLFLEWLVVARDLEVEGLPPRIADTEEWAHLACFLIAEVTVIHSVVISATGSTATDIVLSRGIIIAGRVASRCNPFLRFMSVVSPVLGTSELL